MNLLIAKDINHGKIKRDMSALKRLISLAKKHGWMCVVSGGYGLDFAMGRITRSHGDLDVIVYGQNDRSEAEKTLTEHFGVQNTLVTDEEFYRVFDVNCSGFGADIYYVQTLNEPAVDIHKVIKANGSVVTNGDADFPPPVKGELSGIRVLVQDQDAHRRDILAKGGAANPKYKNDLENITALLSSA